MLLQISIGTVLVFALGLPAMALPAFGRQLFQIVEHRPATAAWILIGAALGALSYAGTRRTALVRWLDTLQHEIAHLAWALMLGGTPSSLQVEPHGGSVSYTLQGPLAQLRAFLVSVAPYSCSPVLVIPIALALLRAPTPGLWLGVLSFLLGLSLSVPLGQIHPKQPDLRRYGLWPAIAAAVWLWSASVVMAGELLITGSMSSAYERGFRVLSRIVETP